MDTAKIGAPIEGAGEATKILIPARSYSVSLVLAAAVFSPHQQRMNDRWLWRPWKRFFDGQPDCDVFLLRMSC